MAGESLETYWELSFNCYVNCYNSNGRELPMSYGCNEFSIKATT
jgi:hypothetical protein